MLSMVWHWVTAWVFGWGGVGALVAIAAWALWAFTPAILISFKSSILHVAVGATAFALASTYFFSSGYNAGYTAAINQVVRLDQDAIDRVNAGKASMLACRAGGGEWDVTTGKCK